MAKKMDISRPAGGLAFSSKAQEEMLRLNQEFSLLHAELERQMKELEEKLSRYKELYDSAPLGYLTLTRDGKIIEANRTAKIMMGAECLLLTGIPFNRFVAAEDHSAIEALLEGVFSKRVPANGEVILVPTGTRPQQHSTPGLTVQISVHLDAVMSESSYECRVILSDITERKQAQEIIRRSSNGFRKLFREHVYIMLLIDPDNGNIIDANKAAAVFYGRSIDELKLMSIRDINVLAPEVVNSDMAKYRNEKQTRFIRRHRMADGTVRDVDVASNIIEREGKEVFFAIINDITERKQVEDELHRLNRALQATNNCNQALVHTDNEVELLEKICQIIVNTGGYRMAWIGYAEHDIEKRIRPVAQAGFEDGYLETRRISWADDRYGQGPVGRAIRTGQACSTINVLLDPNFELWRVEAMQRGYASVYSLPLTADKKVFGVFTIYSEVPDAFDTQEAELLSGLADNLAYGIVMLRNRVARKQAERLLKLSEERFRTMFERHSAIMMLVDPDTGRIIDANMAAVAFYGWSIEELKAMRIQQINTLPSEEVEAAMEKCRTGEQNIFLFRHRRMDGSIRDVESYICTFKTKEKELFYSIINDITDSKRAAEEGERIKSAFLSNISHDLRAPIHGIIGLSELLKEPELTIDEQVSYIDLIHRGGERLLHLLNDLIDISRLEAGGVKLQITETPINKLLGELHAFFEVKAKKKGLRFQCTTGLDDRESVIETDGLRLSQILTNLIHNALKFTNTGGIHIGYERKNGNLEFYCIDSGCGIPAAMKKKIFDRFQQVDSPSIRSGEGAGLGLNIAKDFVALLGGTIGVESEEGKGCRFFFTLPYNPSNAARSPVIQEPARSVAGITILLAEDDAVSDLLMKAVLKKENMSIISADNGQTAVQMAADHPEINIVLMDINMPVMNGFEATARIKQLRPDLPVIAQTAYTSKEEQEKAREAGCEGFITKPINKSELLELIKRLLDR